MNLKFNAVILLIGFCVGGFAVYKLMPKPIPQVITVESIKTNTKIVKVTKPNGQVTESTEIVSKSGLSNTTVSKKLYGIGLYHDKSIFGEIRLGQLPLHIIGDTNLKEHKIGIKLEF